MEDVLALYTNSFFGSRVSQMSFETFCWVGSFGVTIRCPLVQYMLPWPVFVSCHSFERCQFYCVECNLIVSAFTPIQYHQYGWQIPDSRRSNLGLIRPTTFCLPKVHEVTLQYCSGNEGVELLLKIEIFTARYAGLFLSNVHFLNELSVCYVYEIKSKLLKLLVSKSYK
jgi:hypothetical protein